MTNICVAELTNSPAIAGVARLDLDHFDSQLDSPSFNQRLPNNNLSIGMDLQLFSVQVSDVVNWFVLSLVIRPGHQFSQQSNGNKLKSDKYQ